MRTVRVMFGRTLGRLWRSFPAVLSISLFLAVVGARFAFVLMRGDGGSTPVAALWALAAAPFLPVLASLLTARLVADERMSGRLELLLTAPLLERDIAVGMFLGAWFALAMTLAVYLLVPFAVLPFFSPVLAAQLSLLDFLPAFAALLLQSMLWCACGLLASVCFRPSGVAALVSLLLMVGLPYGAFHASLAWLPILRARLSELPSESHLIDLATGLVHSSAFAFYVVLALFALFAAAKALAYARLAGRGARGERLSTIGVVLLAFVFSCCAIALAIRTDLAIELPWRDASVRASARTRQILADTSGKPVSVTCFLARQAPEFRAVARLLRGLEATAAGVAGAELHVKYVDPRWELREAARLVRAGVPEGSLVFRRGNRPLCVPVSSLFSSSTNGVTAVTDTGVFVGESVCASAIQRLTLPAQRETVYWTTGHGESAPSSYDPVFGMSDIAREMMQDGYQIQSLDLAQVSTVPSDCAVLVVAGARDPFSRTEMKRLDNYLRTGGRLLVLAGPLLNAGVGALLADWGVRLLPYTAVSPRTLNGADVLVTALADHAVTRPLEGGTVLFEDAVALEAVGIAIGTNRVEAAFSADRTGFTPLASTDDRAWGESDPSVRPWTFDPATDRRGPLVLAAALERGGGVSRDLAIRPTRIVVIGDATFVLNGPLARRANANRDFFLNSLAWLAGLDALTEARTPGNVIVTRMARSDWMRFGVLSALVPSGLVLLLGWLALLCRRRRS